MSFIMTSLIRVSSVMSLTMTSLIRVSRVMSSSLCFCKTMFLHQGCVVRYLRYAIPSSGLASTGCWNRTPRPERLTLWKESYRIWVHQRVTTTKYGSRQLSYKTFQNVSWLLTNRQRSWTGFHVSWWFSLALGKPSPYIDMRNCIKCTKIKVKQFRQESTNRHTNGQTDATKCIISLASRSIKMVKKLCSASQCSRAF